MFALRAGIRNWICQPPMPAFGCPHNWRMEQIGAQYQHSFTPKSSSYSQYRAGLTRVSLTLCLPPAYGPEIHAALPLPSATSHAGEQHCPPSSFASDSRRPPFLIWRAASRSPPPSADSGGPRMVCRSRCAKGWAER